MKTKLNELFASQLKFPDSRNLQQRGIADKIEDECNRLICENFEDVKLPRSRRSIEDITIGNTYIDHKTSDEALNFKMPNLISIARLRKLDKELIYNFVIYNSNTKQIINTFCLNVFELNWDHLSIQNLGQGQLQITNMVEFLKSPKTNLTKEQWIQRLQKEAVKFYQKVQKTAIKRESDWKNWTI